jgi:quercetin dioxygenase-like cupin family protein
MQRRKPGEHPVSYGTDKSSLNLVLLGVNRTSMVLFLCRKPFLSKADSGWQSADGIRVAEIGPIPGISNEPYTASYMESGNAPGIVTAIHRHDGPELFYTLVGELCLETPDGMKLGHAGESTIAPPSVPMRLTNVGTERRRSLVLVLHETAKPMATPVSDWTPKGLCKPIGEK